ncbi:uncharacterized protein PG998_007965 [Apiospora kogelbergensis]|uniref:uncharacterized protein n=1 Tax=Apiospora kogelbergensis TaxID=1337665 RepID=UPI00312D7787
MRLLSLFVSLALSILPCAVVADGTFLTPGGDAGKTTLYTGEKFDVEWAGTAAYSILSLGYYSSSNITIKWLISNSPNYPTSYTWTPRPALDGFSSWEQDQFFLYIVNGTNFGAPFQSPAFTIRKKSYNHISFDHCRIHSRRPNHGPGDEPDASVGASDSANIDAGGLSTGAKAGIGAGVGGGALLIIGLLAFFLLKRRRVEGSHGVYESPADQDNKADAHLADPRGHEKVLIQQTAKPVEAPSTTQDGGRPTAELGTQSRERFELA